LVSYSDLDVDLNPIDLARRLNPLVVPEYVIFCVMFAMFLVGGFWIEVAFNLPIAAWYLYRFVQKQHRVDATQVFSDLNFNKNQALVKLIFFMISFFLYLYRMVYYLVSDYLEAGY
jgi:hypothetical protein